MIMTQANITADGQTSYNYTIECNGKHEHNMFPVDTRECLLLLGLRKTKQTMTLKVIKC
jgi:hypothetical protein